MSCFNVFPGVCLLQNVLLQAVCEQDLAKCKFLKDMNNDQMLKYDSSFVFCIFYTIHILNLTLGFCYYMIYGYLMFKCSIFNVHKLGNVFNFDSGTTSCD